MNGERLEEEVVMVDEYMVVSVLFLLGKGSCRFLRDLVGLCFGLQGK